MEGERPHLNPHRDAELQRGKAADRFYAGVSGTVKAAKLEPVMTRSRMRQQQWEDTFDKGFRAFREWRSVTWPFRREEMRPPALEWPKTRESIGTGAAFRFSNAWIGFDPGELDPRYLRAYDMSTRNLEEDIDSGEWMSATDFVQDWNSRTS